MRWVVVGLALVLGAGAARAADETPPLPKVAWSFSGPFGTFDRASAQRGFQVYNEVCSSCHSMRLMSYRNLEGIGLTPGQVRTVAASKTVPGGVNDSGDPFTRPGLPSDRFLSPYANDNAAKSANGAIPPDQSDLEKAREGGASYLYGILTGYKDAPAGVTVASGLYYNVYFPGHQIHMPPPLHDDAVTYADGTKATADQMAHDVVTFLTYAANPEMEQRKRMGVKMVIFFTLLTGVTYAMKRQVWSDVH